MGQQETPDPRTHAIIGVAMAVHRQLGCGFLEPVYQEALAIEMQETGISFRREWELPVAYRGRRLKTKYIIDFICIDEVAVELKALTTLTGNEQAQLLNYMKAGGFEVGLLINFGQRSLEFKRLVYSGNHRSA